MATVHTGDRKFDSAGNTSMAGILPSHRESWSVVEHKQESRVRPEKGGGGSDHHHGQLEGGRNFRTQRKGGEHTALPTREHPVREQSSPCHSLLLKPGCAHMEYTLHVELLKELQFPNKRSKNNVFI